MTGTLFSASRDAHLLFTSEWARLLNIWCYCERVVSPLHSKPVTLPAEAGTHLYSWVVKSKSEFSVLLKDTTRSPHGVRTPDLGVMSPELYHWATGAREEETQLLDCNRFDPTLAVVYLVAWDIINWTVIFVLELRAVVRLSILGEQERNFSSFFLILLLFSTIFFFSLFPRFLSQFDPSGGRQVVILQYLTPKSCLILEYERNFFPTQSAYN